MSANIHNIDRAHHTKLRHQVVIKKNIQLVVIWHFPVGVSYLLLDPTKEVK